MPEELRARIEARAAAANRSSNAKIAVMLTAMMDGVGVVQIAIRSVDNTVPGTLLYAADTSATHSSYKSWVGVSGLNWNLAAGIYFVSFEVPLTSTFFGTMAFEVPNPTGTFAFRDETDWHGLADNPSVVLTHLGFQMFGDPVNVPEPSSVALFILAPGALVLSRRKRVG